jgi:low temperature requirement protein LtrA
VTGLMEHEIGGETTLQGVIVLAIVWFGWCAYTWLGNQAQADEGLLRLAMVMAMGGMFFVAISIPNAFVDGSNAALVLTIAYAVVRLTHLAVYWIAAGDDAQLRSVILSMLGVSLSMLLLLSVGVASDIESRKWWWVAAVVVDQLGVYLVRSTRWRLNSASHFAERFGLIVLIAIGESIVAVGTGTSSPELSGRSALALVCGLAIAVCFWWMYFDVVARVGEQVLHRASGIERVRLARDSYTYVHFLFVSGIVFAAFGLVVLIGDHGHDDAGRYALYGGTICYLVGHFLFRLRNVGGLNIARTIAAFVLIAGIPALASATTLGQVAFVAVVLIAVVAYEVSALSEPRDAIRHGQAH